MLRQVSYYKGHMDKIKGEGGGGGGRCVWLGRVEGQGENADNCNWITIKIKKIKQTFITFIKQTDTKLLLSDNYSVIVFLYYVEEKGTEDWKMGQKLNSSWM